MLRLMKYEFRKSRTGLLVMLLIAAGLFLLAPIGKWTDKNNLLYISVALLGFYSLGAYVFVLVRGISAYYGELRGKTGYLLFMVPKSSASILFSKLLFTLSFAITMMGLCVLALVGSVSILLKVQYEISGLLDMAEFLLGQTGISFSYLTGVAVTMLISVLASVLVLVSAGYLATTISAMLIHGRKMRAFAFIGIFVALLIGLFELNGLVSFDVERGMELSMGMLIRGSLPLSALDLSLTALFTLASAALLKRRLSL